METIQQIQNDPTYQEVLSDSFGGIMYNVANEGKYETEHLEVLYKLLDESERESLDGIMK